MKHFIKILSSLLLLSISIAVTQAYSIDRKDSLRMLITGSAESDLIKIYEDLSWEYMYLIPDSTLYFSALEKELALKQKRPLDVANANNAMGVAYIVKGDYNTAIEKFIKAEEIGNKLLKKNPEDKKVMRRMLSYYVNHGNCYYYFSDFPVAISNYQKALIYAAKIDFKGIGTIYTNLGAIYNELNKNNLSRLYHSKAFKEASRNNDFGSMGQSMNNLGALCFNTLKYDSALYFYKRGISYYRMAGDDYESITTFTNIGNTYSELGQYDSADYYLEKAHAKSMEIDYTEGLIYYYLQKGILLSRQNKNQQAIEVYSKGLELTEKTGRVRVAYLIEEKMSDSYFSLGDYKNAFFTYKNSKAIQDSIFTEESDRQIANLEIKFQVKEKELKISALEKNKAKDRYIKIVLLALIIVIIVSGAIVLMIYIQKRKTEREKSAIEKRLIASELEQSRLKQKELDKELEYKTKQLTTHALNIMQKNNMLTELMESVSDAMQKASPELHQKFKIIKRQIKSSLNADNDWEVFKLYFEQVNARFFENLKAINPSLTYGDMRIAALISLNLNVKETASVLNLAPNSIKSARYKLRKKLNIDPDVSLYDFMISML